MLDSGEVFRVHSQLLELSSTTLAEALAACAPGRAYSLVLPDIDSKAVLLLLHALCAAPATNIWADAQPADQLRALASVCHALGCMQMVHVVDRALVKQANVCITARNAVKCYHLARQLDMQGFARECSKVIARLLPNVVPYMDKGDELWPILFEICKLR